MNRTRTFLGVVAAAAVAAGGLAGISPAGAVSPVTTITVGAGPRGVAYSPDGTRLYATGATGLSVIDTATNTVSTVIPNGTSLGEVAVTPDGGRAYVADISNNAVDVINTATNAVVASVPVADFPYGVAVTPDGTSVLVTRRSTNKVSVISTSTNTVTSEVVVGNGPTDVAVSSTRAVVVNGGANSVTVLNLPAVTVAATVPVGADPYGVTMSPLDETAYVSSRTANSVAVIGSGNTVLATIPVGGGPVATGLSRNGLTLYAAQYVDNKLAAVNLSNRTITGQTATGLQPVSVAVSPDGSRIAVADFTGGTVTMLAAAPKAATLPATAVKGEKATGNGQVTADSADAVSDISCYYGTDPSAVEDGPLGSAARLRATPATAVAGSTVSVTCPFTNLSRGRTYFYVITATDGDGPGWSPQSQSFTTRPPKVASPTVKSKKAKIVLRWTVTRGADEYQGRIRKNGSWRSWQTVVNPKVTFANLKRRTSYKMQLKAGNDAGFGPTRTVTASTR